MSLKSQCRLRAALVFVGSVVSSLALAQPMDHGAHGAPPSQLPLNMRTGPVFVPVQDMQRPPTPSMPDPATTAPGPGAPGQPPAQPPQAGGPPKPGFGGPGGPDSQHRRKSAGRRNPARWTRPRTRSDRRKSAGRPNPVGPDPADPPQVGGPPNPVGPDLAATTSRWTAEARRSRHPVTAADWRAGDGRHAGRMRTAFADAAANQLPAYTPRTGDVVGYQQFPPSGPRQTAWFVATNYGGTKGYFISEAWYLPGPDKPWVKVLDEAGPAEIFVPYQNNAHRFSDLIVLQLPLEPLIDAIRGRCGQLIDRPNSSGRRIVREISEKGLLWIAPQLVVVDGKTNFRGHNVYRGHKLTLWAVVNAWNYRYVLSYSFHDDGSIDFRAGATGTNFPGSEESRIPTTCCGASICASRTSHAAARPTST